MGSPIQISEADFIKATASKEPIQIDERDFPTVESGLLDAMKKGWRQSATAMLLDKALQGKTATEVPIEGLGNQMAASLAIVLGDLPAFMTFGALGAIAPPGAQVVTVPAAAMAGTEAFKAGLQDLQPGETGLDALIRQAKAAAKGGTVGAVMGPLGRISTLPGVRPILQKAGLPLEISGAAAVSSALEGKPVSAEDVALMAAPVLGIKAATTIPKGLAKAKSAKAEAERLEAQRIAAEKAGIPAAAPQAGTTPEATALEIAGATGAGEVGRQRRKREKAIAAVEAGQQVPLDLGTGSPIEPGQVVRGEQGELFPITPIEEVKGDTKSGERIQGVLGEREGAVEVGTEPSAGETTTTAGRVLQAPEGEGAKEAGPALTDSELNDLWRLGYPVLKEIEPKGEEPKIILNKKILDMKTPDEWRSTLKDATGARVFTPEEVAAAEQAGITAAEYARQKTAAQYVEHDANLAWLEEHGIDYLSNESKERVSEKTPAEVSAIVKALKGEEPVSARHAEVKAALDRLMQRVEGLDEVLEADVKEVDPLFLQKAADNIALAIKAANLADTELRPFLEEGGWIRPIQDVSKGVQDAIDAQTRISKMTDKELDAYINALHDNEISMTPTPLAKIMPKAEEPAPSVPAKTPGQVRRERKAPAAKPSAAEEKMINDFALEMGEHFDISTAEAHKRIQAAFKVLPELPTAERLDIIREKAGMPEAEDIMGEERGVSNFIADVSEVIGGGNTPTMFGGQIAYEGLVNRLLKGEGLTKKQEAARKRIVRDWERFSIDAAREGKTVYQYMMEQGVPVGYATPFMGPFDRKQRIEFSDASSHWAEEPTRGGYESVWNRMLTDKSYRLGEVFDHPELYALYPDFSKIWVEKVKPIESGWRGSLVGRLRIKLSEELDSKQARKTLLHEIMHRIQREEGFAAGGWGKLSDMVNYRDQIRKYYTSMVNKSNDPVVTKNYKDRLDMLDKIESNPDMLSHEESLSKSEKNILDSMTIDAYLLRAGEIEARTVVHRADMPGYTRYMAKPVFEGIAPDMAIVKFDQGAWDKEWHDRTKNKPAETSKGEQIRERSRPTQSSYTLDFMGLQQMYERVQDFIKRARAVKSGPTTELVRELQGENGPQSVYRSDKPAKEKDLLTKQGEWVRGPLYRYNGTIAEKPVFDILSADSYANHRTHQDYSVLRDAKKGLSEQEQKNVRKVLEGKIEGNEKEREAALTIRRWLDEKRAEYQGFLRAEYRKHLSEKELEVLDMIIGGEDILRVVAKANRLGVDPEVMLDIAKEYKAIDKWGLDDYVTKVELGRWKVMADVMREDGKNSRQVVAVGLSKEHAADKAASWLAEHPEVDRLYLDDSFIPFSDEKTSVTPAQYGSMMNKLAKAIRDQEEDLGKGIARKMAQKAISRNFIVEPSKVWSPFVQERRYQLRGEENVFDILPAYARSMNRKMNLDPVLDEIRGLSSKMPPNMRAGVLELADAVKGKYYAEDQAVDALLKALANTRIGQAAGWEPRGKALTRAIANMREIETKVKMGFRPIAAIVNFVTGQMNIWAKTGTNYYVRGALFLRTPEGRALIKEEAPYLGVNVLEDPSGQLKRESRSLRMYSWVELPNREMSIAANYLYAKEKYGMSDAAAREFARKANWMQQTLYTVGALPRALRSPVGRLVGQFKPWLANQIEFFNSLSPIEKARYSAAMLAITGPQGAIIMLKSLPILGLMGLWDDIAEWLNKEFPRLGRGAAGALTGADVGASAVPQLPQSGTDWIGPTLSDMTKIWSGIIKPLIDGEKLNWRNYNDVAQSIVPVWKHMYRVVEQMVDKDGWVKDERGRRLYQIPKDPADIAAFSARTAASAESIDIAQKKLAMRIWERKENILNKNKEHTVDRVLDTVMKGGQISDDLLADIKKYGVTNSSLLRSATYRKMTPEQRLYFRTELRRRPDLVESFPWAFSPAPDTTK